MILVRRVLHDRGYAKLERVFSSSELRPVLDDTRSLIESWAAGTIEGADYWTYQPPEANGPILYRIHDLEKKSSAVREILFSKRLQAAVEPIVGLGATPTACALTIKMPGYGVAVPWHRDPIEVPPKTVFNFSIYLDQSDESNGCLFVLPGSHLSADIVWAGNNTPKDAVPLEATVGDILVHDVLILHGSPECRNNPIRRAVVIEFQPPPSSPAVLASDGANVGEVAADLR